MAKKIRFLSLNCPAVMSEWTWQTLASVLSRSDKNCAAAEVCSANLLRASSEQRTSQWDIPSPSCIEEQFSRCPLPKQDHPRPTASFWKVPEQRGPSPGSPKMSTKHQAIGRVQEDFFSSCIKTLPIGPFKGQGGWTKCGKKKRLWKYRVYFK